MDIQCINEIVCYTMHVHENLVIVFSMALFNVLLVLKINVMKQTCLHAFPFLPFPLNCSYVLPFPQPPVPCLIILIILLYTLAHCPGICCCALCYYIKQN